MRQRHLFPYIDNVPRNISTGSTGNSLLYTDLYITPEPRAVSAGVGSTGTGIGPTSMVDPSLDSSRIIGTVGGGSGTGTTSCFTFDTLVTLFDGSKIRIDDVRVGDVLLGENNTENTVLSLIKSHLGSGQLYSINDSDPFVTSGHPRSRHLLDGNL